ncbi:MAG: glycosyltransferase [Proteobacteria bacterium]|nr:glycosyltransferase [Pseudomonadota bacterium]
MLERKPRVLQICHDYQGPFRSIARHYAGCFSDCEVSTLFLRGGQSAELAESLHGEVEFLMLAEGELGGLKLGVARQIREMIGDQVPDIIIAHRYKPFFIAQLLNRELEIPLVLGVMHEYGFLGRLGRSLLSRFWKPNVHLIGVSQPIVDDILSRHRYLQGRVHLVHNALEADELADSVTARHQLGIPLGDYCYGAIGRLVSKKNHELLLRGFARVEGEPFLAIVGDGELRARLEALSRELRIADRVRFCGYQENAHTLMKAFDAFVLPSDHREAFGMVLLEAMAASVPVVTSDAPGPRSVVADTGLLFTSGDADDLAAKLTAVRTMTRAETDAMTTRALNRLGREFAISVMVRRLRELEPVAARAPLSF